MGTVITRHVALNVQRTDTGAKERLIGDLTPEEVDNIKEFFACVEELRSAQFFQKGLGFKWKITFQAGDRLRNPEPLPDDSQLREFLLLMRPFLLHEERTSFNQIRGILGRRLNHPFTRWHLKRLNQEYSGDHSRRWFEVSYDGKVLNSEATFALLLNGLRFHRDRDKQPSIAELRKAFPPDISDAVFYDILTDKAVAVLNLANLIESLEWLAEAPHGSETSTPTQESGEAAT